VALKTIPILPSDNFDETVRFYERLGFAEQGKWPNEYLILQRPGDGFELHFWFKDSVDPKENDVACYVRWDTADEAQALHDEWAAVDVEPGRLHPPCQTDYGLLEFALIDGHGNLVRVGGSLDPD
jgi:catechol 2,3-dioxygenase-like lactoylglutathione lyase family enzyme